MSVRAVIDRLAAHDGLNFVLTNRIPRTTASRLAGWFSTIEQPLVARLSIRALALFAGDLRLHEAERTDFRSLHDCFVRRLRPGARPLDTSPGALISPCDGIVVAKGRIRDTTLVQAKGLDYTLEALLGDATLAARYRDGSYVTLRLTAAMYHHFHAPADAEVHEVRFIPGDTWNVNPPALARVPRLYCRNTRAIVPLSLDHTPAAVTLVAVGAILVSSIELTFVAGPLHRAVGPGGRLACHARLRKGDDMGWFRHGSTIVVLAAPGLELDDHVSEGAVMRMGQRLFRVSRSPA